jgi:hypothetical protein
MDGYIHEMGIYLEKTGQDAKWVMTTTHATVMKPSFMSG